VPIGFALVIFRLSSPSCAISTTFVTAARLRRRQTVRLGGPTCFGNNLCNQTVELGWDFYGPVCSSWSRGAGRAGLGRDRHRPRSSCWSGRARCRWRWWAKACSHGIDAFALTAVPLFILTGDVLVRTGLSRKFLDVAEALTQFAKGGFGSATVLVCGMFAAISGSDAAGAAAVGRMTIDRLVERAIRVPMPARWSPPGPVPAS
jgi:hypothetical protein